MEEQEIMNRAFNTTSNTLKIDDTGTITKKTSSKDLSTSTALSYTTNFAKTTKILGVMFHFSAATSETVTISVDNSVGSNYDTLVKSQALTSATDYFWQPDNEFIISSADEIKVTCTCANYANTVYVTVLGEDGE